MRANGNPRAARRPWHVASVTGRLGASTRGSRAAREAAVFDKITVLESFSPRGPTTNPYLTQLLACGSTDISIEPFSWKQAIVGHYDVLHLHWPEFLLRGPGRLRAVPRWLGFVSLMTGMDPPHPRNRPTHRRSCSHHPSWGLRHLVCGPGRSDNQTRPPPVLRFDPAVQRRRATDGRLQRDR